MTVATSANRDRPSNETAAAANGIASMTTRPASILALEPIEHVGRHCRALDAEVLDEDNEHQHADEHVEEEQEGKDQREPGRDHSPASVAPFSSTRNPSTCEGA